MKKGETLKILIHKRAPVFVAALFFISGLYISAKLFKFSVDENFFGSLIPTYVIGVILFTLAVLAALLYGFKKKATIVILILICVMGMFISQLKLNHVYGSRTYIMHDEIVGRVIDVRDNGENSISLILNNAELKNENETQKVKGNISLILYGESAQFLRSNFSLINSVVSAEASLMYPSSASEYGFKDERLELLSQNVYYKALAHYASVDVVWQGREPVVFNFFQKIRENVYGREKRYIGGDEAEYYHALITGSKSTLSSEIKSDFSSLGISHLLATSGLHIGVLLLLINFALKKMHAPIAVKSIISILIILVFLFFADFRVSMVRASIMWLVLVGARLVGEKSNVLNSLGIAMLIMTVINPMSIFDISFVLSCSCVCAIALFSDLTEFTRQVKKGRKLAEVLCVSAIIMIFMWPVNAYYFNEVSILSPIFNVIFVPIASIELMLGMCFALLSSFGFMAGILGYILKVIAFCTTSLASFMVNLSPVLSVSSPRLWIIVIWMLGIAIMSKRVAAGGKTIRKVTAIVCVTIVIASVLIIKIKDINTSYIKIYSDGSVAFMYLKDGDENAMILNDESYLSDTVINKNGDFELDTLIYSGNDADTLEEILMGLEDISIKSIFAHESVVKLYEEQYSQEIQSFSEYEFLEWKIYFLEFKAKSKTAKTHYAVHLNNEENSILYLDPLSIREGAFKTNTFDDVISSRWSKSRAENIAHINSDNIYYSGNNVVLYNSVLTLEQSGSSIYNISQRAIEIYDGNEDN